MEVGLYHNFQLPSSNIQASKPMDQYAVYCLALPSCRWCNKFLGSNATLRNFLIPCVIGPPDENFCHIIVHFVGWMSRTGCVCSTFCHSTQHERGWWCSLVYIYSSPPRYQPIALISRRPNILIAIALISMKSVKWAVSPWPGSESDATLRYWALLSYW